MRKKANKYFIALHYLQSFFGLSFALFITYVSFNDNFGRTIDSSGELLLSLFLISYSLAHIILLLKNNINIIQVITYPFIYTVFGFYWSISNAGYVKNWAPSTHTETIQQNLQSLIIILLIVIIALLTTYNHFFFKEKL